MSNEKEPSQELTQLEWISLQKEIRNGGRGMPEETASSKFNRKFRESPFVPIGCLTTAAILSVGLYSLIKGKKVMSQRMMRFRVLAQGLTIGAVMLSLVTSVYQSK